MPHTRQTKVLEVQSQSLLSSNLHPIHPHTNHIRPQSLSLTHTLTHNINPWQHHNQYTYQQQSHNITHLQDRERSAVPHTRQTQVLEVRYQSLPLANLHPKHPHTNHIRPQSLSPSYSLTIPIHRTKKKTRIHKVYHKYLVYSGFLPPPPPMHIKTITQHHSHRRVREVSFAPHPADASA